MGSESIDILRLLETCHAIEVASERLYLLFAEAHAAHPTMAQLWRKTAREEQSHAAQFRLLMAAHGAVVERASVDSTVAIAALHELEARLARYRIESPTVVEGLSFALSLEERLSRFHADTAAVFRDPSHQRLFRAMMAADDRHTDALREALDSYGGQTTPDDSRPQRNPPKPPPRR